MRLPIALDYRPALLSSAGIGRATRELARALAERDDLDVHLFAHSLARARVANRCPNGATLHRLPIPGRSLPTLHQFGLGADRLAGRVRVFHWTDYVHPPLSRAAAVLTVHDLAFVRDASWHGPNAVDLRERTRRAIGAARAVIVPSAASAQDLRTFAPASTNVHVVPFGADHVPTTASPHPLGGRPFVLCLGTIEPRKNHRTLLLAVRQLAAPRPLLVVAGRIGWQCRDIEALLRNAVADGMALWLQDADDTAIWQLLQHARCLVYPSLWEGFGFPPLEALQLGVPVVANDIAPLREFGDDTMRFVDATDPGALAAALDEVLHDDARRSPRIQRGRQRAADFRWQRTAAAHAAIYREVLS